MSKTPMHNQDLNQRFDRSTMRSTLSDDVHRTAVKIAFSFTGRIDPQTAFAALRLPIVKYAPTAMLGAQKASIHGDNWMNAGQVDPIIVLLDDDIHAALPLAEFIIAQFPWPLLVKHYNCKVTFDEFLDCMAALIPDAPERYSAMEENRSLFTEMVNS